MLTLFGDYETFYSKDYSLRRMTPVEYILDPRFECIGFGAAENDGKPFWVEAEDVPRYLAGLPKPTAMVSHNALFDQCVAAWRHGYIPDLMIDTMGMARAMLAAKLKGVSLALVAKHLGLQAKGDTILKVEGMNREMIKAAGLWDAYVNYCLGDVDICRGVYRALMSQGFPKSEILVMDTVLRCAVEPKFELDPELLHKHLHEVQQRKETLLQRCGLATRDDLMSNERFAEALRRLGVEPPMKVSPATGKETYAFAKTDPAMQALDEHDNPDVQALVAARLGIKSTIEETRTERFINISRLQWPDGSTGLMPIPLRYSGAHTHRLSGDWKLNLQNLPRGGTLRKALKARKGRVIVVADASQIEARVNAWFCGQDDLVQQFEDGVDTYAAFASDVFGFVVVKKDHPAERFIGKTCVLGLGYNLGWPKFKAKIASDSYLQLPQQIILDDMEANRIVSLYRGKFSKISGMWKTLNSIIPQMTSPSCHIQIGPVVFQHESVLLPNGLRLYYHGLHLKDGEWWFTYNGKPKRLYGGKLLENIIQALSRICTMDAAVRTRKRLARLGDPSLGLAIQVHDELGFSPPEDVANVVKATLEEEMRVRPDWGTGIPLDVESDLALTYGDAK